MLTLLGFLCYAQGKLTQQMEAINTTSVPENEKKKEREEGVSFTFCYTEHHFSALLAPGKLRRGHQTSIR